MRSERIMKGTRVKTKPKMIVRTKKAKRKEMRK